MKQNFTLTLMLAAAMGVACLQADAQVTPFDGWV